MLSDYLWPKEIYENCSRSKRLADRKRQYDEQTQAKKVCPRKLGVEDSIETCVGFSADATSVKPWSLALLQPGTGNTVLRHEDLVQDMSIFEKFITRKAFKRI